jgi:hypothetical protein
MNTHSNVTLDLARTLVADRLDEAEHRRLVDSIRTASRRRGIARSQDRVRFVVRRIRDVLPMPVGVTPGVVRTRPGSAR